MKKLNFFFKVFSGFLEPGKTTLHNHILYINEGLKKCFYKKKIDIGLSLITCLFLISFLSAQHNHNGLNHWEIPSVNPDRIILTFHGNPATSRAVTWRTNTQILKGVAQIAMSTRNSNFKKNVSTYQSTTESFQLGKYKGNKSLIVNYHSVVFKDLKPNTQYLYRVGDGKKYWSEWIQFTTAEEKKGETKFVYFGDAQNDVLSEWSRVIRKAYEMAPDASFVIHAGDLINDAHRDREWAEWYKAGGFIHSQWTAIPVLGNHEFMPLNRNDDSRNTSIQWRPQFTLQVEETLTEKLHETVYTVDYQNVRVIVLNSNFNLKEQTKYLEQKLKTSEDKWIIVTCHHSIFSPAKGRDFEYGRKNWKPLFDQYNVDLVLNGHDHSYARGQVAEMDNVVKQEEINQTIYVTSVSGPKQYKQDYEQLKSYIKNGYQLDKSGNYVQFFQVVTIDQNKLTYVAYTATGKEYDRFEIIKDPDTGEKLIND